MRIAVVGTGVAGLVCAHLLNPGHEVTVLEAAARPGGHSNTVTLTVGGQPVSADTGFLVYNERTYPGLVTLFRRLGIATTPSDMSFSVTDQRHGLQYRGTSPATLFAQPANVARPRFLRMLADVGRFNRLGRRRLAEAAVTGETLGEVLSEGRWSRAFLEWYLLPLASAIWSADHADVLAMPATTTWRFFECHGLLSMGDKPSWRTVQGGSTRYVEAALAPMRAAGRLKLSSPVRHLRRTGDGVELRTAAGEATHYDRVVVATHGDQALAMLVDATPAEKEILGAFRYRDNRLVVHTDERFLPTRPRARASWNYHWPAVPTGRATLTYDLSRLQDLRVTRPLLATMNPHDEVNPSSVLAELHYAHPVLDREAIAAQRRWREVHDGGPVSFCGAYWGYGFHEDGVQSALAVCQTLGSGW